jgi:hypothetical protein
MTLSQVAWAHCRHIAAGRDTAGQLSWVELAVPAAAQAGAVYIVRYAVASDHAVCDCEMARRGQPCFHAGVGLAYGRAAMARRG